MRPSNQPNKLNIVTLVLFLIIFGLALYLYQKDFSLDPKELDRSQARFSGNRSEHLSNKSDFPSSDRSKEAYQKLAPQLGLELEGKGLLLGNPIFIRIFKSDKVLELWVKHRSGQYRLFKTYKVCYYSGNLGPKLQEGDKQAPEGFYYVNANRMNPNSQYHLSFNIGFPNEYDRSLDRTGSFIMVHGSCVSIGCYAMTDQYIEEIYVLGEAALRHGQDFFRVHIFPFRMSKVSVEENKDSKWYFFWKNLKQGFDYFQHYKVPPKLRIENQQYYFEEDPNEPIIR